MYDLDVDWGERNPDIRPIITIRRAGGERGGRRQDGGRLREERRRKNYIAALKTTAPSLYLAASTLPETEESGEGGPGIEAERGE